MLVTRARQGTHTCTQASMQERVKRSFAHHTHAPVYPCHIHGMGCGMGPRKVLLWCRLVCVCVCTSPSTTTAAVAVCLSGYALLAMGKCPSSPFLPFRHSLCMPAVLWPSLTLPHSSLSPFLARLQSCACVCVAGALWLDQQQQQHEAYRRGKKREERGTHKKFISS